MENNQIDPARLERVVKEAEKLVASGRLTAAEAERLRGASDPSRAEAVLRDIRARHAGERLDVAVAEGAMSREEADDILERVRGGEHSVKLRSHLAKILPRRRSKGNSVGPSLESDSGQDRLA